MCPWYVISVYFDFKSRTKCFWHTLFTNTRTLTRVLLYPYSGFQTNFYFSFPVSAGTSIGKLFPPWRAYIDCSSARCVKVTHNAVMTLVCFPFDLLDARNLHRKAEDDPAPTRLNVCAKITQVVLSLAYLLYDTVRQDAPGPGTTALVVVACLSDLLLLGCESYTLYTTIHRPDTSQTMTAVWITACEVCAVWGSGATATWAGADT
jgi:hypothetical protein